MPTTRSQTAAAAEQDAGALHQDHEMPDIPQDTFECVSCMEQHATEPVDVDGDEMCHDCFVHGVVPDFEEALKNSTIYPVRYAGVTLDISDYEKFFTPAFLAEFRKKENEYKTPVPKRVYCANDITTVHDDRTETDRCNTFLGSKTDRKSVIYCECGGKTCRKCFEAVQGLSWKHVCTEHVTEDDAFAGLERGVDYQVCPNEDCLLKLELRDGCNHVVCSGCHTGFCFICGEEVDEDENHWRVGQPCPRYGKKDSERRIHDPPEVFRGFAGGLAFAAGFLNMMDEDPLVAMRVREMDEAVRAQQGPQENLGNVPAVQESPERILFNNHHGLLNRVHTEALRNMLNNPLASAAHGLASTAHGLVHLLEPALQIYVHQIDNPDAVPFRFVNANRDRKDNILTLIESVDEDALYRAYPQLEVVVGGWDAAWAGQLAAFLR